MEKIASFKVDHLKLLPGLYVSRRDEKNGVAVTTFDMRFTAPNREPVMNTAPIHTIEHIGATFLRNSAIAEDVIYFGPMGCRTGFYLVLFGDRRSEDIADTVTEMCDYILGFEGEIPGAKPNECGNYLDQNLDEAKYYIRRYKEELKNKRFQYE